MELGLRLKQARQEAGLSQRQLCGERITRNMLSQIENGLAQPSMDTLRYLAARLGKPVSYFLEEDTASANQGLMPRLRSAYEAGQYDEVLALLEEYSAPDPVFDQEAALLRLLATMDKAEQAIAQGKKPYAAQLLRQPVSTIYFTRELQRRRLLLLAQADSGALEQVLEQLPQEDEELLLRGQWALSAGKPEEAARYLDAAQNRQTEQWHLLRGQAYFALGNYQHAAAEFALAEDKSLPWLEQCYEKMGDYKMAYFYACKQREKKGE